MNITKIIYEKYPKAWEKFSQYINKTLFHESKIKQRLKIVNKFIVRFSTIQTSIDFIFLYGLLVDFFDYNGFVIDICFDCDEYFWFNIYKSQMCLYSSLLDCKESWKTRPEAQKEAILKACEIMEERLND